MYNAFRFLAIVILSSLILSCSTTKIASDRKPEPGTSLAVFKVTLDHDKAKDGKGRYMPFDLTLVKIENGEPVSKTFVQKLETNKLFLLNLEPGKYALETGIFYGSWKENYGFGTAEFNVEPGKVSYGGDILINTKVKMSGTGTIGTGGTISYRYSMSQLVVFKTKTVEQFKQKFPTVANEKELVITNRENKIYF